MAAGGDTDQEYNYVTGKWQPKWKGAPYPLNAQNGMSTQTLPGVTVSNSSKINPIQPNSFTGFTGSNSIDNKWQSNTEALPDNLMPRKDVVKPDGTHVITGNKAVGDWGTQYKTPLENKTDFKIEAQSPIGASTDRKKAFNGSNIIPYISNIANSLKKVPLPDAPGLINPIGRRQVNYDAQRVEADRQMQGANVSADKNLDENTAAAFKGSTLASNIRGKNAISEAESNTNAQLGMQTDQINASIEGQNTSMMNQWKNNLVEARVAGQREQSANLSNAADKYVAQQNVNSQRDLDIKRLGVYEGLFKSSGVMNRQIGESDDAGYRKYLKENGLTDNVIAPKKVARYGGAVLKYGGRMKVY